MIGVFARADHPKGYGLPDGRAHGYSMLFVTGSRKQIRDCQERLQDFRKPFIGPLGKHYYSDGGLGEWYGGRFELLAVLPGDRVEHVHGGDVHVTGQKFLSRGDNRFSGIFTAEEVLNG